MNTPYLDAGLPLEEHGKHLSDEQRRGILCENVADLYQIDLSSLN